MSKIVQLKDGGGAIYPMTSEYEMKRLYLGALFQGRTVGGVLTADNNSVSTYDVVAFPYLKVQLKAKLPAGIVAQFYVNDTSKGDIVNYPKSSNAATRQWKSASNGDDIINNDSSFICTYRITFTRKGGGALKVSDVEAWIEKEQIAFYYKSSRMSIVERNMDMEPAAKSLGIVFKRTDSKDGTFLNALPVFVHGSDFHGDAVRFKNFYEYAKYISADAALATGDFVPAMGDDEMEYISYISKDKKVPLLACVGNHDRCGYSSDKFYSHVISKINNGFVFPSGVSNPTYYYKDVVHNGIGFRIIVLNQYVDNGTWSITVYLTAAQKKFFIDALLSTPANYGVIVAAHDPTKNIPSPGAGLDTFYNNPDEQKPFGNFQEAYDIIDAFIERKSKSGTWSDDSGSYSYTADFTKLNSGVEFIAWCTGHYHRDNIGYVAGTQEKQLILEVACDNALMMRYWDTDMGRDGDGKSQDLFNVYGIDRTNKKVKVVRIGANVNMDMKEVKQMVIPYA